jgi:hypothetical protein
LLASCKDGCPEGQMIACGFTIPDMVELVREVEMTEKPWCLADLKFEPMGDDLREKATINGVKIVREDGRYWIRTETGPHYDNLAEEGVDPALNYLFGQKRGG